MPIRQQLSLNGRAIARDLRSANLRALAFHSKGFARALGQLVFTKETVVCLLLGGLLGLGLALSF